ncbi:MAG: nodulation protein NfeD [Synergistetes bacterium]|nr:nodulation protein NfeD [Synergistota bacterium]
MKKTLRSIVFFIPLLWVFSLTCPAFSVTLYKGDISGVINPVTVKYIDTVFEKVKDPEDTLILFTMDTPGGLVSSMRMIVQKFLNSSVPVIVYVYPSGARAASAGTFILMSAHIAAMAPGTTVGAAHPVTIGGGGGGEKEEKIMEGKIVNDLVALIKAIAKERGRNEKWAEMAIRTSATLTADEALREGVIDIVSPSMESLLKDINGRKVKVSSKKEVKIELDDYKVVEVEMPWYYEVLHFIGDPNVAYLLLFIGFYALIFEVTHPGAIIPGVIGALCLILFFFSFQILPFSIAGLSLVFLGIILLVLELFIVSHGILTIGGAISLLLGSFMLMKPGEETPYVKISTSLILGIVAATVAFFSFALGLALYAQRRKPLSGKEGMIGEKGIAKTNLSPVGTVLVHGELWRAVSVEGEIAEGEKVEVVGINGLTLKVKKIEEGKEE